MGTTVKQVFISLIQKLGMSIDHPLTRVFYHLYCGEIFVPLLLSSHWRNFCATLLH